MRNAAIFLVFLAACAGPELNLPQGLTEPTLEAVVKNGNPLWNPAVVRIESVRVLSGSETSPGRYEFDAEYKLRRIASSPKTTFQQLTEQREVASNRGDEKRAAQISDAIRKLEASEKRIANLNEGKSKKLKDRFVMVRTKNGWTLDAWAKSLAAPPPKDD